MVGLLALVCFNKNHVMLLKQNVEWFVFCDPYSPSM